MYKKLFSHALGIFLHATLAMMIIDWAVPELFWKGLLGPYEILFVLMGFSFLACFLLNGKTMIRQVKQFLAASKWQVLSILAYLLMGVVTLFYANSLSYALTKYIVIVQMLVFGVCVFVYAAERREAGKDALQEIFANICISSVISALLGFYGFFSGTRLVYLDRICPIQDYNQYTTILLIGLVCGVCWLLNLKCKKPIRYLAIGVLCCILFPTVFLSGSRRSYVLLIALISLLVVYLVVSEVYAFAKEKSGKKLALGLGSILLCVACVATATNFLDSAVKNVADIRLKLITGTPTVPTEPTEPITEPTKPTTEPTKPITEPIKPITEPTKPITEPEVVFPDVIIPGNDLEETYQTIVSGSAMGKRKVIWNAALDKIMHTDALRLLVGYGAAYSSDMYDDLSNPEVVKVHNAYGYSATNPAGKNWMYVHNLFLQDLLDGGILLLAAQLLVIGLAAAYTIKILIREPLHGAILGVMYGILLVTLFLSSGRGMSSNKLFWLITTMQILAWNALPQKVKK